MFYSFHREWNCWDSKTSFKCDNACSSIILQKGVASSLCTCMHFIKFLLGRTLGNLFRCLLFFHLDMKVWKSLTLYPIFHIIVHFSTVKNLSKKKNPSSITNLKMIDPRVKESNTSRCHYYSFIYSFLILLLK